jgi:hypothetical protein
VSSDKITTTIRYNPVYGRRVIRVWDVYRQQWRRFAPDQHIPDQIMASLPERDRARIRRAQAAEVSS